MCKSYTFHVPNSSSRITIILPRQIHKDLDYAGEESVSLSRNLAPCFCDLDSTRTISQQYQQLSSEPTSGAVVHCVLQ